MKNSSLFKKTLHVFLFINILFSEYIPNDILKNIQNNRYEWRLMQYESKDWEQGAWVDSYTFSFSYDGNNNIIEIYGTSEFYNIRYIVTYDNLGNQIERLMQYKTIDGFEWNNGYLEVLTYDQNNKLIQSVNQEWNGNNWDNTRLYSYIYNDLVLIERVESIFSGFGWSEFMCDLYTYNEDNFLIQRTLTNWNSSQNSCYENGSNIYYYTYDENNNLIQEMLQYNGLDNVREIRTYDENNNQIEWIEQRLIGSGWFNESLFTNYIYENYVNNCPDNIEGDLNFDGFVNVIDIVSLVNCILSIQNCEVCSDVNYDGIINVIDIVSLVNIILDL
tara:strand:- start:771 stop:1766 length:996 start_codon:yes stop_codon:yes gene_type:complete